MQLSERCLQSGASGNRVTTLKLFGFESLFAYVTASNQFTFSTGQFHRVKLDGLLLLALAILLAYLGPFHVKRTCKCH